ncbi:DUF4340 domain-containing protein [Bowmanella dokdonensis]|uniref:DUF4340 domain-containing protein n=1 Tax=Bowmanella dokdonensis TaxID=751969 RepID=A0A939DLV9_9ALTE|nr:DUF4340 domain-containing protein [Bowmanella dokdonensis]MBN7824873.1 DUF4340 domain-containing protein [Bowmanella dokdonensis]
MNRHVLYLLLILLLGGLGGFLLMQKDQQVGGLEQGLLLPELAARAGDLVTIRVQDGQGQNIEVSLVDGQWRVSSHGQYPADEEKLSQLLTELLEAKKLQAKTGQAEHYHRLGLQDIDAPDSSASLLTISTATQSWQLLVGNVPASGQGQFVRMADGGQSWLIDQGLSLPVLARDWMRQPVLDIPEENVASVSRLDANQRWQVKRTTMTEDFLLASKPDGRMLKYATILNGLVSNLTNINFEDVRPLEDSFWQSLTPVASLQLSLFDGTELTLELAVQDGKHFLRVSGTEQGAYWENWLYQVSNFTASQINKEQEDFLAEPAEPEDKLPVSVEEGDAPR